MHLWLHQSLGLLAASATAAAGATAAAVVQVVLLQQCILAGKAQKGLQLPDSSWQQNLA